MDNNKEMMKKHDAMTSGSSDNNKLYKGVRKRKWGKYVSEIRLPNSRERIWLGSYDSPEKAARAFDCALYLLRGRHASFNFPDTPFNLDINVAAAGERSLTPQEIQEVAAKFGNQEQPPQPQHQHHDDVANFESHIGGESNFTTTNTTTTAASSSNSTMQVENGGNMMMNTIDWTFLNVLDNESTTTTHESYLGGGDYNFGLYSELDKMHSGEFHQLYSTPPTPPPYEDNNIGDEYDPFSNQSSFLWSWNF